MARQSVHLTSPRRPTDQQCRDAWKQRAEGHLLRLMRPGRPYRVAELAEILCRATAKRHIVSELCISAVRSFLLDAWHAQQVSFDEDSRTWTVVAV